MITWIAGIIILCIVFFWWFKKPFIHKNKTINDIKKFIDNLALRCADGSILYIKHSNTGKFVQIAKFNNNLKDCALIFSYPKAKWSERYFDQIRMAINDAGFESSVDWLYDGEIDAFLEVKLEGELDKITLNAVEISKIALYTMGIDDNDSLHMHYDADLI